MYTECGTCIEVSSTALVKIVEGRVVMVVASVEIFMLSLDMYFVFVEGYIIRNIIFVGLVGCYVLDRRTSSQ